MVIPVNLDIWCLCGGHNCNLEYEISKAQVTIL